jgi:hypothetical protein
MGKTVFKKFFRLTGGTGFPVSGTIENDFLFFGKCWKTRLKFRK